jgi:hypothetical protein
MSVAPDGRCTLRGWRTANNRPAGHVSNQSSLGERETFGADMRDVPSSQRSGRASRRRSSERAVARRHRKLAVAIHRGDSGLRDP